MSDEVKRIIKMLLLTGQRVGEVCGINPGEVEDRWWTLPPERTKNGQTHRVYLTKTAIKLLGTSHNGFYFLSPVSKTDSEGNPIYAHIDENAVAYAIRKNLKGYQPRRPIKGEHVSMVKVPEEKKMELAHFTPHDLRRTFSTGLAKLGFHDEIIDMVTGHKKQGIIKVYNRHKYDTEKKQALQAWEQKLLLIIT
jgi:integrase